MINNANKALGYAEVYYNYRTEKFFTDAVGNQFLELDITFEGGGDSSGVSSIIAGTGISVDQSSGAVTITADTESSTLDDVTGRGSTTTNDISIGRLTASKIGLPSLSALPTTNLNFGDLCALTSDNRPYFYDGTDWRKLYLVDVPPAPGDPDTDWDQVILRLTFDTNLSDGSDNGYSDSHDSGVARVGSPKKFGTHSVKLEGNSLYYANIPNFVASAFTIEFWIYLDKYVYGSTSTKVVNLVGYDSTAFRYSGTNGSSVVTFTLSDYFGTKTFVSNVTFSKQTWHHIAFSRNATSGVITLYIDGTAAGTVSGNDIDSANGAWTMLGDYDHGDLFMDDVRISSFERYTSNFTPPTAALPISD